MRAALLLPDSSNPSTSSTSATASLGTVSSNSYEEASHDGSRDLSWAGGQRVQAVAFVPGGDGADSNSSCMWVSLLAARPRVEFHMSAGGTGPPPHVTFDSKVRDA